MPADSTHFWLILWRAYDSVREHAVRHIASLGLGFSDFAVMEYLLHKGPSPVNIVGAKIRLSSGSITAAIDRLERKGMVERRDDPVDRRARIVHLTGDGRKAIEDEARRGLGGRGAEGPAGQPAGRGVTRGGAHAGGEVVVFCP